MLLFRPFQSQSDEAVHEGRHGDALMLHQLGVHTDGGEAGEGVDLVDEDAAGVLLHKEVAAGQTLAAQRRVGHGGVGLHLVQLFLRQFGRNDHLTDAVLVLVAIYDFLSQFTKTHIIGKVISILLSAVLLYTFLFTSKVDTTLDKISSNGNNVQEITDVVDVVVLKKDKAQSLSDTLSYTFGYNSTVDADDNQDAIQKINFNNNADIKTKEYTTWEDIIPALEAGTDIQAMLINDNTLSSFDEEYEEFLDSIRIVGTIELKRTIELSESDKKVNEEPFVIYISGNDEEGKILSTGRSDVNILCVIHPITRQVLLITTPRDAYINLTNPGTGAQGYDKLTHAGQWGIEGSILNLQNLYDLNIDYYVKINFTGCETIVDALGGVTINSSVDFVNGLEAAPTRYHYVIGDNECNGEQT